MRTSAFAASSLLAVCTTAIAAGTAYTSPSAPSAIVISGNDHGVGYRSTLSDDDTGVTTSLTSGRFVLARDGRSVAVEAGNGDVIETVPLVVQIGGHDLRLRADLDREGTALTVRSTDKNMVADVRAFDDMVARIARSPITHPGHLHYIGGVGALVGALLGAVIFAVVGVLIGAMFLVVGAVPGLILGLGVGFVIGGALGFFVV